VAAVPSALAVLHVELSRELAAAAALALKTPPPWAALLAVGGVLFLVAGARRRWLLAGPAGAVLGLVVARLAVLALDGPGAAVQPEARWVAAGTGALLCLAWPSALPPLGLAVPGLVVGWAFPIAGRPWLGALVAALAGAGIGALLKEWVAAAAAGGVGAAALLGGALGLLARRPIATELAERPMALLAAWVIVAVAGAAFHAGRAWPPPRRDRGGDAISPPDPAERTARTDA
jgi:hypothetical protein